MPAPIIANTVEALRDGVAAARRQGRSVGLVPTMGALHEGHLALVARARREAGYAIASIFVNPTQFAVGEDLAKYPRNLGDDLAKLERAGADLAFIPEAGVMYPEGFSTRIEMKGPGAAGLEDRIRPEHFGGVCTVVAKLFVQSGADIAVFGEKDYQQLCVVRRLAQDLDLPIRVLGEPTMRDTDGLALSSRNRYLSPQHRAAAPILYRTLKAMAGSLASGAHRGTILAEGRELIERAGFRLDYLELRDAASLDILPDPAIRPARLLVAARIGDVRLIDNVAL